MGGEKDRQAEGGKEKELLSEEQEREKMIRDEKAYLR